MQSHIYRIMVSASVGVVVGVTLVGRVLGYGSLEFIFAKTREHVSLETFEVLSATRNTISSDVVPRWDEGIAKVTSLK